MDFGPAARATRTCASSPTTPATRPKSPKAPTYGAPQDQIQAFRAFQITPEYQERFGYPALTDEIKRKVLGLNALRLHDIDPITAKCQFTRHELEQIRLTLPTGNETFGPRTTSDLRAYVRHHRAETGAT